MQARDIALEVLNFPDRGRLLPEHYLERAFKRYPHVTPRDRAFTFNLVQGVYRWRIHLDWIVKQSLQFPFKKIEPRVLNVLRIALFQIYFMDRVPQSAAVNEAVKQAKRVSKGHAAGFVNGILRQICRHKQEVAFPDKESEPVQYLSSFYSYPPWLVKKWLREMGMGPAESLMEACNRIPQLVLRTNRLKIKRDGLIKLLEKEGLSAKPTDYSPDGIKVDNLKGRVMGLKSFRKGLFQVQSEAAQLCSHLLNPGAEESVLDLCAGLGGKSTHLAELMGGKGRIVSLDINHARLVKLLGSSLRLGIGCIQCLVADAGRNLSWLKYPSFDKILVDGPCSGLGVLSRHPDGKWARDENDIKRLSVLQRNIMCETVPLLKKDGELLYVTCTLSEEENEGVVHGFLESNRGMRLINLNDNAPEGISTFIDDQGYFRTLPHVHGMDGFFAALFHKQD